MTAYGFHLLRQSQSLLFLPVHDQKIIKTIFIIIIWSSDDSGKLVKAAV